MKSKKQYILPIVIGELFFIFFTLGQNAAIFRSNIYVNLIGIILGTLLIYSTVIALISFNKINYNKVTLGYAKAYIIFSITFIISLIGKHFFFKKEIENYKTIIEKKQLNFTTNFKACSILQYGTFLVDDRDTIIRYKENNKELEQLISANKNTIYVIKWIDSCTYLRIDKKTNIASYKIKLGNINDVFHNLYISPVGLHKINKEQILNSIKIK